MPADQELIGIVDYSKPWPGPTIDTAAFSNTNSSDYWSSTTGRASDDGIAWSVDFGDGDVGLYYMHYYLYVRCVRGGQ